MHSFYIAIITSQIYEEKLILLIVLFDNLWLSIWNVFMEK